jgi:branched-chain amino acid aminotransferase
MDEAKAIWLDGSLVPWDEAKVHILTHALCHGTGVFEGIRCHDTIHGPAIFRLEDHIARLYRSARSILMELAWTPQEVMEGVLELLAVIGQPSAYLRVIAFRAYGEMFVNPARNPVTVAIAGWNQPLSFAGEGYERGIRTLISSWRRPDSSSVPAGAKLTGSYAVAGLARMEAELAGYDDAIMLGPRGMVAEAVIANLFVVRAGKLLTPPLADGPLGGITRETILTLASERGVACAEQSLTRLELYGADEIFLTGTGVGLVPLREVDGRAFDAPGPVTVELRDAYRLVTSGRSEEHAPWLTPVAKALAEQPAEAVQIAGV